MARAVIEETIAGGVGGMCLVFVGHPLDTIKVRLQTMVVVPGQPPPYKGFLDCATKMFQKEGPLSFYKGMGAPLLGVTPMYSLCFLGYGVGKQIFWTEHTLQDLDLMRIGLAGATSGIFTTPILAPLERLKCVLQVQNARAAEDPTIKKFSGPFPLAKHILATEGARSLFRGYFATNLRDSVASVAYFATYEWLKRKLTPEGQQRPSVWGTLFAGGMAGIMNWLPAIPMDTLKSRLQIAPDGKYKHGIRSVAREIIQAEGMGGIRTLYRGTASVIIRAFPANAATFLGYETAKRFLKSFGTAEPEKTA